MNIEEIKLVEIAPYDRNPRKNDKAVEAVANSIKEFGFKVPIVLDKDNVIIAGHTRYKAALRLSLESVPCIRADDLNDEQVKAFRLADNKVGELAEWDEDLLDKELSDIFEIDMTCFGFDSLGGEVEDEKYTTKDTIPQYGITGEHPKVCELVGTEKADSLIERIEGAEGITTEEKKFLLDAAKRHLVFN